MIPYSNWWPQEPHPHWQETWSMYNHKTKQAIRLIAKCGSTTIEKQSASSRWTLTKLFRPGVGVFSPETQWSVMWRDPWQRWLSAVTHRIYKRGWQSIRWPGVRQPHAPPHWQPVNLDDVEWDEFTLSQWQQSYGVQGDVTVYMMEDCGHELMNINLAVSDQQIVMQNHTSAIPLKQEIREQLERKIDPFQRDRVMKRYKRDQAVCDWYWSDRQWPGLVRARKFNVAV